MSVSIIWSLTNGGDPLTSIVDHGNSSNGQVTTAKTIYIRHDGSNDITDAGLYIRQFSGTYQGAATAAADIAEILSWGDQIIESDFGGFQINFDAVGGFPSASWPTYSTKSPTNGNVHRNGVGDSESNAIEIPGTVTGATADGTIQAGTAPNVRFQVRVAVPASENVIGIRQWDQVLKYTFTS